MRERARDAGGPGTLTDDLAVPEADPSALPGEPLAELAVRYRLRPGVFAYAGQLWARRHFIVGFAVALVVGFVFFWEAETRYGCG